MLPADPRLCSSARVSGRRRDRLISRSSRIVLGEVPERSNEFALDSALEGGGFEPSVPRLRWSSVQLSWRRATRPMPPRKPIVRVDEFGERFPHARRAFHMDKSRRRARDRLLRLRISGGAFFAFSATLEICRDDRIWHQERMPNSGRK